MDKISMCYFCGHPEHQHEWFTRKGTEEQPNGKVRVCYCKITGCPCCESVRVEPAEILQFPVKTFTDVR